MWGQINLGSNMIKWLLWCVITTSISVLLNGVPSEPFKIHKALRQGDPISSFSFNIVAESLNFVILEAFSNGLISGLHTEDN